MDALTMHTDEERIDAALVRRLLADQMPHWAGLPLSRFPSTGTVNAIYRLGDDMCVRLPRVARWADGLDREVRWLATLAPQLPLAVPEPLAEGRPAHGYPLRWAVYRWLAGEAVTPGPGAGRIAADLAGFVAALRRIDPAGAPRCTRGTEGLPARDGVTRQAILAVRDVFDIDALIRAWDESLEAPAWDYPATNPPFVAMATRAVEEVLADHRQGGPEDRGRAP